jgi:hypothetical protein
MMNFNKWYLKVCSIFLLLHTFVCTALADSTDFSKLNTNQSNTENLNPDNLADASILYENGKIYLVVLVLLTIFAGIIIYLVRLELKLNKLEKELKNK